VVSHQESIFACLGPGTGWGGQRGVNTWQDAVAYLTDEVMKTGAKVCIIGWWRLVWILGAELKRRGLQCIWRREARHRFSSESQGRRWATHDIISKFWTDAWVWPSLEETPGGAAAIEWMLTGPATLPNWIKIEELVDAAFRNARQNGRAPLCLPLALESKVRHGVSAGHCAYSEIYPRSFFASAKTVSSYRCPSGTALCFGLDGVSVPRRGSPTRLSGTL
jgi:hypothetical protein